VRSKVLLVMGMGATLAAPQQFDDTSWMTTHWTADDSGYIAIQSHFRNLNGDRYKLDREVDAAAKKCLGPEPSPADLFRWSCALLERSKGDFDYSMSVWNSHKLQAPKDVFPRVSQPASYQFTRMRFLIVSWLDFPGHKMVPMAEALHIRDPNDRAVALTLLYLYQPSAPNRYPQDRAKGVALVKYIDQHFPQDAVTWAKTGWFYYKSWMATKSKADALEAIRRSGEARELTKSAEQRKLIDQEKQKMIKGTPGLGG